MNGGREDIEMGLDGLEADAGEVELVVMEVVESTGGSETSDGTEANDTSLCDFCCRASNARLDRQDVAHGLFLNPLWI